MSILILLLDPGSTSPPCILLNRFLVLLSVGRLWPLCIAARRNQLGCETAATPRAHPCPNIPRSPTAWADQVTSLAMPCICHCSHFHGSKTSHLVVFDVIDCDDTALKPHTTYPNLDGAWTRPSRVQTPSN
eukprot:5176777-Pyramimonas_sp.AAC.2